MRLKFAETILLICRVELPQQLNQASGIALQNYSDLDSKKFSDIRHHYEKGFMSLARKIILMGGKKALSYDRDLMNINIKRGAI